MSLALLPKLFEETCCTYDVGVYEDEAAMVIQAPLPGVKKENVKIALKDKVLTIQGTMEEEKRQKIHRKLSEQFEYQIGLPQFIDEQAAIEATLENGMLTVTLPKSRAAKPIQITVK